MAADDNPAPVLDLVPPLAALLPHSPAPYIALMLVGLRDRHPRPPRPAPAGWSPPA